MGRQRRLHRCAGSRSTSLVSNEVLCIDTRVVVDHDLPKTFESFAGVHHKGVMVDGFSSMSTRNLCKFTPAPVQEDCLPSLTIMHGTFIPGQTTCVQRLPTCCPDGKCKAQTFLGWLCGKQPPGKNLEFWFSSQLQRMILSFSLNALNESIIQAMFKSRLVSKFLSWPLTTRCS